MSHAVMWTATAERALERLPEKVASAAIEFIYGSLAQNPQRVGTSPRFELEGLHSARWGDYRVIHDAMVTIMAIQHRRIAHAEAGTPPREVHGCWVLCASVARLRVLTR